MKQPTCRATQTRARTQRQRKLKRRVQRAPASYRLRGVTRACLQEDAAYKSPRDMNYLRRYAIASKAAEGILQDNNDDIRQRRPIAEQIALLARDHKFWVVQQRCIHGTGANDGEEECSVGESATGPNSIAWSGNSGHSTAVSGVQRCMSGTTLYIDRP